MAAAASSFLNSGLAVTIASLVQARAAAQVAAELGQSILLLSTPAAAAQAGGGWFAALIETLHSQGKNSVIGILDCGSQPGWVLESLTLPLHGVVFSESRAPSGAVVGERLRGLVTNAGRLYFTERPMAINLIDFQDEEATVAFLRREWHHG
ncbi:MAG: hypothetical protein QM523_06185 [Candidatus Pacebacteria bacterium]|nr:hypothetical protein [Candidatus Paceibacterota bacterium]